MPAPHTAVIVNPNAQGGNLGRRWPSLARDVRRQVGGFDELLTQSPGDGTRLARQALQQGADIVVAVGGDGTINEVANGFFTDGDPVKPDAALAVLPVGTGGDFRKSIGVPNDIDRAAKIIAGNRRRTIDVGRLRCQGPLGETDNIFVNICSFGISGLVNQYIHRTSKRLGGRAGFYLASTKAALTYQNQRVRLVFDNDTDNAVETIIYLVAIANGRYFGGGMKIAPRAELDDERFDVIALGDVSKTEVLLNTPRIYTGSHLELDKVSTRHARSIRAEPIDQDDVLIDLDGESPGKLPLVIDLLPAALKIIVP